jgi:eukaryotic-like serine/threonine-protein kinase
MQRPVDIDRLPDAAKNSDDMHEKRNVEQSQSRPLSEPPPRASEGHLGRYRLAFEMASGGMASLYLAVAENPGGFGKALALKRIHPHLAKERDFRDMFLDEARVASMLQHPNICGVLDYGEDEGLPFFTMEYLLGEPLSRVQRAQGRILDERPRERARFAARVIADAAHGLHAAHELRDPQGRFVELVHRDVSPQNLIVTYDGITRVVDFGIARTRVQEHHTATGTIKGKFAYMAPEQLLDEDVDRRADVWALGVLLWETIAGARLFKRKTEMETLLAVTQGPIADPRVLHADLDPDLSAIVSRALKRERDERYETADEMARDLERYLVKAREPFGPAEVSAQLHRLFPDGLDQKRALIAEALARRPGALPEVKIQPWNTPTTSLQGLEEVSIVVTTDADDDERPAHRGIWAAAIVGLAVVALVAVFFAVRPYPFGTEAQPESERARDIVPPIENSVGAPPIAGPAQTPEPPRPALAPAPPPIVVEVPATIQRARRRAPAPAPRAAEPAPPVEPAPAPREAPAEERRRPFIVETLDLQAAPPAQEETPRRPLIVDELEE